MPALIISTSIDLLRVTTDNIVYIASEGNYSNLVLSDGETRLVTLQLGQIERLIGEQLKDTCGDFVRIGKSLIVNKNYIFYIHPAKQQLMLSNGNGVKYTLSASREALRMLKDLLCEMVTGE